MKLKLTLFTFLLLANLGVNAQIGIGTSTPNKDAILDLYSSNKGLLLPRVATTSAITTPVNGMIVYDTSSNCIRTYQDDSWSDCFDNTALTVDCNGFTGSYCTNGLSSTSYTVRITNNGGTAKQITPQTSDLRLSGVSGITVSAVSPNTATTINAGASLLIRYTFSGTPAASGTLKGAFSKQGMSCFSTLTVGGTRTVSAASATPTVQLNTAITPITHITTSSTGIGTATGLPAGLTATWANNTITISGVPMASGTFYYSIPVYGCGSAVSATGSIKVICGAYMAGGIYKEFMCHNLGANTTLNPLIPVQAIFGSIYQWGTAYPICDASKPSNEPVNEWQSTPAPTDAWLDSSKTANDPCPTGYRVPTAAQWQEVLDNNSITITGQAPWAVDNNFNKAVNIGHNLSLPAAGWVAEHYIENRNMNGFYWSTSKTDVAWYPSEKKTLQFSDDAENSGGLLLFDFAPEMGFSVRCISE